MPQIHNGRPPTYELAAAEPAPDVVEESSTVVTPPSDVVEPAPRKRNVARANAGR